MNFSTIKIRNEIIPVHMILLSRHEPDQCGVSDDDITAVMMMS